MSLFCFNNTMHLTWHGLHKFVPNFKFVFQHDLAWQGFFVMVCPPFAYMPVFWDHMDSTSLCQTCSLILSHHDLTIDNSLFFAMVCPPFAFMTACTRAGMDSTVQNLMTHIIPAWVVSAPQGFSWCLSLQVPSYMSSGVTVRWLSGLFGFLKLPGVFWLTILLQCESVSTRIQTRGWSASLRNGVVLSLGKGGVKLEQVSNSRGDKTATDLNVPTTMIHCGFETLWFHSHTPFCYWHKSLTGLSVNRSFFPGMIFPGVLCEMLVFLSPPPAFDLVSTPEKWFRNCCSSAETPEDSLLLTEHLQIGVLCCLFSKFCFFLRQLWNMHK